jgi:hypothetical protein
MTAPITARSAIAHCLLMGQGAYETPEAFADAVLKRLAHDGFAVVPIKEPQDLSRATMLMRLAAQYIRTHAPFDTIHYDEADCDGSCLADDLDIEAGQIDPQS